MVWRREGRVWYGTGSVGVHHAVCSDISYRTRACRHVHVDIDSACIIWTLIYVHSSAAPDKLFIGIDPQVLHKVFQFFILTYGHDIVGFASNDN